MLTIHFCNLLLSVSALCYLWRRQLIYLHLLQQDEYDIARFLRLVVTRPTSGKRTTAYLALPIAMSFGVSIMSSGIIAVIAPVLHIVTSAVFIYLTAGERNPRIEAKKPLVMTARCTRIAFISLLLQFLLLASIGLVYSATISTLWILALVALAVVVFLPLFISMAVLLLVPIELLLKSYYMRDAKATLRRFHPIVIGVTGSYGKTSTKHILGHIMNASAPTLITPGSVNTLLGVARIIRERLSKTHKYFVVEMGAYGIGSIERLCDFVEPQHGLITSIGMAHHERFKSIENVARAKFELAAAVIARSGTLVLNKDQIPHELVPSSVNAYRPLCLVSTSSESSSITLAIGEEATTCSGQRDPAKAAQFLISNRRMTSVGIEFELNLNGENVAVVAPLFGLFNCNNIAMALACATSLGIPAITALSAVRTLPQTSHRLEVKRQQNGYTLIDDAYNSNPEGFREALDVLSLLGLQSGGRRILVTPGMVELGTKHDSVHEQLGEYAASRCDVALFVGSKRIPTMVESFSRAAQNSECIECNSLQDALHWIEGNASPSDVVLLENDLPDLYQSVKLTS